MRTTAHLPAPPAFSVEIQITRMIGKIIAVAKSSENVSGVGITATEITTEATKVTNNFHHLFIEISTIIDLRKTHQPINSEPSSPFSNFIRYEVLNASTSLSVLTGLLM